MNGTVYYEALLATVLEALASVEHERWSHWQRHMHAKSARQPDGSLLVPADLVMRWERQMRINYSELDESEKESDREQVRKYLPLIVETIDGIRISELA